MGGFPNLSRVKPRKRPNAKAKIAGPKTALFDDTAVGMAVLVVGCLGTRGCYDT